MPGIVCGAAVNTGSEARAIERHEVPMNEIGITIDVKHYIGRFLVEYFLVGLGNILRPDSCAVVAWLLQSFDN